MCFKAKTNTSTTKVELPKYQQDMVKDNLERAQEESLKPYEAYGGERIAGPNENTIAGRNDLLGISNTGIAGLAEAQGYTRDAMGRATALGDYTTGNFTEANYSDPTKFTGSNVTDYMSPYMQAVIDSNKNNAVLDFNRLTGARNDKAVNAGAFGGSRRFVQEGMDQEALLRNLGDIQSRGMQDAYTSGMGQFNADRTAMTDVERARADELSRVQAGVEGSRQFGAGQGLDAIKVGQGLAGDLTAQGELERQTGIQNAQLKDTVGKAYTGEQQAQLDLDYQNFLEKQGYTRDQINFMTSQLAGQPGQSTTTQNTPGANPLAQVVGAGLSGLSLYNAYK